MSDWRLTVVPHEGLEPYISALKGRRADLYTNGAYRVTYSELRIGTPHPLAHVMAYPGRDWSGYCAFPPAGFGHYPSVSIFSTTFLDIYYCELAVYERATFNFRSKPYATGLYLWNRSTRDYRSGADR